MSQNFTISTQDAIDAFEKEADLFFRQILEINYNECLVTDESRLSDFSSCGLPDDFPDYTTLEDLYDAWDTYILQKINTLYNTSYTMTNMLLIDLLRDLYQINKSNILH